MDRKNHGEEAYAQPAENLKFRKPNHFSRKKKALTALIIFLILIVVAAVGFGVYKLFDLRNRYDDSASFYFSSNILSEDGGEFKAVGSIEFDVYNYADSLRTSKEKIENFDIKVMANGKDITRKATVVTGERSMEADVRSACNVSIEIPREYHSKLIEVEVTSKPTEIVLKGSFDYEPAWGYEIKDDGVCVELIIFANKDTSVNLEWDEKKLIADSTNSYVEESGIEKNKCTVSLAGGMSASVYFFKTDVKDEFTNNTKAIKIKENTKNVKVEQSVPTEESEAKKDE